MTEGIEAAARIVVEIASGYALVGVLFGAAFVTLGVGRIDPAARRAGWGFRMLIFPGTVAFWPLLLTRWLRGAQPPEEVNAHRRAARHRP